MIGFSRYYLISFPCFLILLKLWLEPSSPPQKISSIHVKEFINNFKYPCSIHEVTTEDGYINTLFRIPNGRNEYKKIQNRVPVLLLPGALQSAVDYVLTGPEKALGLLLADKGYDVWLGNLRGTTWSRKHIKLNADRDPEYWNYTGHHYSVYDIPSLIDYILTETNNTKLHYIGFSQGVALSFVALSERPEYNDKIRLISALAPAVNLKNFDNFLLKTAVSCTNLIKTAFSYGKPIEVMSQNSFVASYFKFICNGSWILKNLCTFHIKCLQGGFEQLDMNLLPLLSSYVPSGLSSQSLLHILQALKKGMVEKFDYGEDINLQVYGSKLAGKYNFTKVTTPVALYYSEKDYLINSKSVEELNLVCSNVIKNHVINKSANFHHLDFLWGNNASSLVYNSIIEEMLIY